MERTTLSYQQTELVTTCYDLAIVYELDYEEPGVLCSASVGAFKVLNVLVTVNDLILHNDCPALVEFFNNLFENDPQSPGGFAEWVLNEIRDQIDAKNNNY